MVGPMGMVVDHDKVATVGQQAIDQPGRSAAVDLAELVYIDQAKHEVAVLLNPHGGTYMKFECEGIPARGEGPFLAPGSPLNTETTSFTTTLSKSGAPEGVQTPDEYEGAGGEKLKAIPLGEKTTT
jgi:hypothetical protein